MKRSGIAWSALLLAIVAAAGFFVAPYGYKQDWWSVTEVFKLILPLATLLALIALFLSVMGLGHSWFGTGRRGKLVSLLAIVVSVLTLYMPVTQFMRSQTLPPIHDVSTDITTPPPFEALLAERSGSSNSTEHGGEDVARQQLCAYPQLQSLVLNRLPEAVFPVAVKVAEQQDWQPILDDPVRGRIEAVDTSRWFGFKDDIVTVKNGYGRNFLIPQKQAVLATVSAKKVLAENLKQRAFKEKKIVDDANKIAEAIKALEIKIPAKVGAGDKLFGSVNNINVAEALEKEGQSIDKKFITVTTVKRLGKYTAVVRLHREVSVDLDFEVIAQA